MNFLILFSTKYKLHAGRNMVYFFAKLISRTVLGKEEALNTLLLSKINKFIDMFHLLSPIPRTLLS